MILGGASPAAADHGVDPVEAPVPRAQCGPGSDPETDRQGRVPLEEVNNGRAARGYRCNTELLGRSGPEGARGGAGGYKVFRYVDALDQECAYYDTTLLFPANVVAGQEPGVWVLDMSNPANPVRTAVLNTPAMLSPHESLAFNTKRGLLVAVAGTPVTAPGVVDIYDVTADCRRPVLRSSLPVGTLGHESGIAPDGNTYYTASLDGQTLTAIDISNPDLPRVLWATTDFPSHGLSISEDGNRAYLASRNSAAFQAGLPGSREGLIVLDVSEVQARKLNPQVTQIGTTLQWPKISTPQATIPVTIDGAPYLIEVDEFASGNNVGAARIIDMADENNPRVISNIKLEVNMTENRPSQVNDNGASDGLQGYAGHYCEVPQRYEPTVLACTFILSGLRLFDIRDPYHPTEIAYFNGPILASNTPAFPGSSYAMSAPAFVPERKEIWYSDGNSGFYSVRITNDAWPLPEPGVALAFASGVALLAALRQLPRAGKRSTSLFLG